jgi:type II secretory pathway pseudopilin PulG
MRQLSPEIAEAMSHFSPTTAPVVFCAYGEESAIRGVSAGGGADAGAILFGGAIAIPNLMRARTSANESSAVATLRTINAAQTAYSGKYLQNGYARDLASLGPDPRGSGLKTANHAGLIESDLGGAGCITGAWSEKSEYRFSVAGVCRVRSRQEFVAVATPVSNSTGSRSFCSTSDAVIRFAAGSTLISPVSAQECRQWQPLQ